jgi:hypothetical protein
MPDTNDFDVTRTRLKERILQVEGGGFESLALEVFRFQVEHNPVYRAYVESLRRTPSSVQSLERIPFLPISFFKKHRVICGARDTGKVFESSGTTGTETSRHRVSDLALYEQLSVRLFEKRYGPLKDYHILALLPSYLERDTSSLVYMVRHFMAESGSPYSGFFLNDFQALNRALEELMARSDGRKVLLIGVTFALLDWAEAMGSSKSALDPLRLVVMETGGMKGRRKEMLRMEVHETLKQRLGVSEVHSEYGMTELVSQSYSHGNGVFQAEASMRVLVRDVTDPLTLGLENQTGGLNVVDLGNLDSCAFVETADLARWNTRDNSFEILGRLDNSDVRGCSLLYV